VRGLRRGAGAFIAAALLLLLPALLLSCASSPGAQQDSAAVPELGAAWLQGIRDKIQAGQLPQAYQDISLLERQPQHQVVPEVLDALKDEVVIDLTEAFRADVAKEDYRSAFSAYCSLLDIGQAAVLPDWSVTRLLLAMARQSQAAGDNPAALQHALRALALGDPGEDLLRLLLQLSNEAGNGLLHDRIQRMMLQAGYSLPEGSAQRITEIPPFEKMVRGTVTIWVNRGIKLEGGVGLPDRVIGSGFYIDPRGYLLTNYHVIESEVDPKYEGYSRLYVRPSDKVETRIPAKVVGYDRIFDLALIKAEVTPEFIFSYGGAPQPKVGEHILAIGSPAGLENTVTSGIVSATGRRFLQMGDAMQVDVPVNYGNSGGPLLNEGGQLVGVVFAGLEQFEGVNFAIPFDWVARVLPGLYRGQEVKHPWLGMALHEGEKGLEVVYTAPGSPAQRAGLQAGDLLVSLNDQPCAGIGALQGALLDLDFPCLVTLEWQRQEQRFRGALSLEERPYSPLEEALGKDRRDRVLYPLFGMELEKTGQFLWRTNYVLRRVLPGSIADETGLSKGDPLTIEGWRVDEENHVAYLQIQVKKRKSGFLPTLIQLGAYLQTDNFV
jgi:serine protease Do